VCIKDTIKVSLCIIRYNLIHIGVHLSHTTLILLGAGSSSRFESSVKKQWLYSGERPLWLQVAEHFKKSALFDTIIIVSSSEEIHYMKHFADFTYVTGGASRQASLGNALQMVTSDYVMVSDIARCCIPHSMIKRIFDAREHGACIVPVLPVNDTLYMEGAPIDRERVSIIQTPQLSRTVLLKKALDTDRLFTDESSAIAALGETVYFVEGAPSAHKLTRIEDLAKLPCIQPPSSRTLTGFGIDIHPFEADKEMKLCGVTIDAEFGFKAHSDGDVAIHALIDALLGAAGMGDIGELYPDTDAAYAGADSAVLLKDTVARIRAFGFEIGNVDMTILAQTPRLLPYKTQMRTTLSALLKIAPNFVNIKATTAEKLGFVGRKEGVTVHAVATLTYFDWKNHTTEKTL